MYSATSKRLLLASLALACSLNSLLTGCATLLGPGLIGPDPRSNNVPPPFQTLTPPKEPILRTETGTHTARVGALSLDAEERYLVTGSRDKTVRVWELASGKLLKILRPPIGKDMEGSIYSVAISPNGQTIAASGWTGREWDKSTSIYLFDWKTGQLTHRITGLPEVVFRLTYSPDGSFLVATLGGSHGIRVYRTSDWTEVEGRTYGGYTYGAAFDRAGRLVTASYDGYLRLYDPQFRLLTKTKAPEGTQPLRVSFSPDGTKVALIFNDLAKAAVLSGKDLSLLYWPDASGVNKNFSSVAWSADGHQLYASGLYNAGGTFYIRKWGDAGRGAYTDLPASHATILDIRSLRAGGIVYVSTEPAFGIFDQDNHRTLFVGPSTTDFRNSRGGKLLLSSDGSVVQFASEQFGNSPARFSVTSRLLELAPEHDSTLASPVTNAPELKVSDWDQKKNPSVNGRPLKLVLDDIPNSVALAPDRTKFLLAGHFALYLFDREGNEIWRVLVPGVAWAVNIAGNGKVAVAALADGTIRWYRVRDGKELLAFFPHADRKRWVLRTTSGYYDAAPGSEELIGWHVNNGAVAVADFFPLSLFRAKYYRPSVVVKVLTTLDEQTALNQANEEVGLRPQEMVLEKQLPPIVTILSPIEDSDVDSSEVTVRFTVRSPSGEPVTGLKTLVDGRPVLARRNLAVIPKTDTPEQAQELQVPVPKGDAEISILAENKYSTSAPATVRIRWKGTTKQDEFVIKPKLYVLAIGVSQYLNKELTLGFAAKDAQDFAAVFQSQQGGLYREVEAKVLIDTQATKEEVLDGLDWITKSMTSKDVAIIFLAGHGVNDPYGVYYFLPSNADPEKLKRTGLAFSDVKNTVASLPGKALVFVDTCHSGNIMGKRRGAPDITSVVNELASAENGAVVFAASTGSQFSLEDPAWGNGAFTKALVEGISGKADYTGKGRISINMLDLYLSERVKELTKGKQTPTTTKPQTIQDFPIALKRQ